MNIWTENKHSIIKNDISHVNVDGFLTSNLEPWNLAIYCMFIDIQSSRFCWNSSAYVSNRGYYYYILWY